MRIRRVSFAVAVSVVAIGALSACSGTSATPEPSSTSSSPSASASPVAVKEGAPSYCAPLAGLLSHTPDGGFPAYISALNDIVQQSKDSGATAVTEGLAAFSSYLTDAQKFSNGATPSAKEKAQLEKTGKQVQAQLKKAAVVITDQCGFDPNTVTSQ